MNFIRNEYRDKSYAKLDSPKVKAPVPAAYQSTQYT